MPLEISEIIEISDPVYMFNEVVSHIDLRKYFAENVSCEPIPEVTYTPDISAEARKEYAERVMRRHKEETEQA